MNPSMFPPENQTSGTDNRSEAIANESPSNTMQSPPHVIPLQLVTFLLQRGFNSQAEDFLTKHLRTTRNALNALAMYQTSAEVPCTAQSLQSAFHNTLTTECTSVGTFILHYLHTHLSAPFASHPLRRVFLLRLSGDINRYLFECTNDVNFASKAASLYHEALSLADTSLDPSDEAYLTLLVNVSCLLRLSSQEELHRRYEHSLNNLLALLDPFERSKYTRVTTFVQMMNMNVSQVSLE